MRIDFKSRHVGFFLITNVPGSNLGEFKLLDFEQNSSGAYAIHNLWIFRLVYSISYVFLTSMPFGHGFSSSMPYSTWLPENSKPRYLDN